MKPPQAEYSSTAGVLLKRQKLESFVLQLSLRHGLRVNIAKAILHSLAKKAMPFDFYELLELQKSEDKSREMQAHPWLQDYYESPDH